MTTEKMFPVGFVPGKDDVGIYVELYSDPAFTLAERIETLDISVLTEDALLSICKRNPHDTGVGIEDPAWLNPVEKRYSYAQTGLRIQMEDLRAREYRFREAISSKKYDVPAAYKALRSTFIRVIGQKVALEYVKRQLSVTTPEERKRQNDAYEAREKAWSERIERKKKILAIAKEHPGFVDDMRFDEAYFIEKYDLTDADLEMIDEMVEEEREEWKKRENIPYDHIERYDWWDGYYSVPMITEKIKMVRKATGLNQRDFAKLIGYPNANKYARFERGELGSPKSWEKIDLIKDICDATSANPYWLEKDMEETVNNVDEDATAKSEEEADSCYTWPMYATNKVIREWWMFYQKRRPRK